MAKKSYPIRKYFRARRIRHIRLMKLTSNLIPLIQEELYPITDPDTIEQAAYFRALSIITLESDLGRIRKDELTLLRISRLPDLSDEAREELVAAIDQFKRERLERLFHV